MMHHDVGHAFQGRCLLVTGGTGTIGSEIVTQLLGWGPQVVRVLSRDETKQCYLRETLGGNPKLRLLVGDVRDRDRLKRAMDGVDVVFHAAALKHVPSCEYNPFEAVQTNVVGTKNLVDAALDAGVKKVVAISTDKAVNPVNTMGATKLLMEKLIATARLWTDDVAMACVRFGNVMDSRGSIVPLIREQVKKGGPVTLTDGSMTRFMMSIKDAVALVLQSSTMMRGGEIFVLKMPCLRIRDLVEVLLDHFAVLYNRRRQAIEVREIGARPGEKIHEELLTPDESGRVEDCGDMLLIPPPGPRAAPGPRIPAALYKSEKGEFLAPDAIRRLLLDAGVIHRTN